MKYLSIITLLFFVSCVTVVDKTVDIPALADVNGRLVTAMKGAENLVLVPDSLRLYVTDLSGYVHLIDGTNVNRLEIVKSLQISDMALGIEIDPDGYLYVNAATTDEWMDEGGAVYRVDAELESAERITGGYPGINGMTQDSEGNLYFAIGNLKLFGAKGAIYKMTYQGNGEYSNPEEFISDLKSPNGMFYDSSQNRLIFTEVFKGVSAYDLDDDTTEPLVGKSRTVEGFDDVCLDSNGDIIIADPPDGLAKIYDANSDMVLLIRIGDTGIGSACQTRITEGVEYLYVTERLTNKQSKEQDGRGLYIIPLDELM